VSGANANSNSSSSNPKPTAGKSGPKRLIEWLTDHDGSRASFQSSCVIDTINVIHQQPVTLFICS
jgi:hypothetical protein